MGRTRVGGLYVLAVVNVMSEALTYVRVVTPPPPWCTRGLFPQPRPLCLADERVSSGLRASVGLLGCSTTPLDLPACGWCS